MSLPQLALLAALSFTAGTVYLVHHSQSADREVRGPPLPLRSARAEVFIRSLNSIQLLTEDAVWRESGSGQTANEGGEPSLVT